MHECVYKCIFCQSLATNTEHITYTFTCPNVLNQHTHTISCVKNRKHHNEISLFEKLLPLKHSRGALTRHKPKHDDKHQHLFSVLIPGFKHKYRMPGGIRPSLRLKKKRASTRARYIGLTT